MKPSTLIFLAASLAAAAGLARYVNAQGNSQAARAAAPGQQRVISYGYPVLPAGPVDPGPRGGTAGAGGPLPGMNTAQTRFFVDGRDKFIEVEGVGEGLGPRFNGDACATCHSFPAIGGSSPLRNPLPAVAVAEGATNSVPWFITPNGPIREVRLKRNADGSFNGNVHALFTIAGRRDAPGCRLAQFNFLPAGNPLTGLGGNANLSFRIPTPLFGTGLIEAIPDSAILANMQSQASFKAQMGIRGRPNFVMTGDPNRSADATVSRFGWKAQNKSLLMFSSEAYNVEMGITNELFTDERDQTPGCVFNGTPEDFPRFNATANTEVISDAQAFANFMRFLDAPTPVADTPTIVNGRALFSSVGCAACHTPTLRTAALISPFSAARPSQAVNLYSDLILHNMGSYLADGISQGQAGPDEFRTAPLWGLGQRVFFLHDGRTSNLLEAIYAHASPGSEANTVIGRYRSLTLREQQDMLNFLRSL